MSIVSKTYILHFKDEYRFIYILVCSYWYIYQVLDINMSMGMGMLVSIVFDCVYFA